MAARPLRVGARMDIVRPTLPQPLPKREGSTIQTPNLQPQSAIRIPQSAIRVPQFLSRRLKRTEQAPAADAIGAVGDGFARQHFRQNGRGVGGIEP